MAVTVETLEKLERKITLTVPAQALTQEVENRLKRLARQVKMDGFRPGKVPLGVVAKMYGASVQMEVVNEKVGQAFGEAATEAQLRVAGTPSITEKEGAPEGELHFDAVFEVFPEVKLGDLSQVEVKRATSEVPAEAVDKTIDLLRKQRRSFAERAQGSAAAASDQLTVDFAGSIDGVAFDGGQASDFRFVLGEGQMLPAFEEAATGMKVGESKTFPLAFPEDYQGKEVAGKTADFVITLKRLEAAHLPEVDEAFIKSLGVESGQADDLRADIQKNLSRELDTRLEGRNKGAAMQALADNAELDLPQASIKDEIQRLMENARAELKQRGLKDADKAPLPEDMFREQAQRRVRLGLIVAELVQKHDLAAKPEQVQAHIEQMASAYERPADVIRWYGSDRNRMAEVEALVVERNVMQHVLSQAKVVDEVVPFDDVMGQ
jgi:trigger factor